MDPTTNPAYEACEAIAGPCISRFGSDVTLHHMPIQSISEAWIATVLVCAIVLIVGYTLILGWRAYQGWKRA